MPLQPYQRCPPTIISAQLSPSIRYKGALQEFTPSHEPRSIDYDEKSQIAGSGTDTKALARYSDAARHTQEARGKNTLDGHTPAQLGPPMHIAGRTFSCDGASSDQGSATTVDEPTRIELLRRFQQERPSHTTDRQVSATISWSTGSCQPQTRSSALEAHAQKRSLLMAKGSIRAKPNYQGCHIDALAVVVVDNRGVRLEDYTRL